MAKGRLPGPQRRLQILAIARAVFADKGFHDTTMTDVADAAGVTKPVLYQHFTSKRDLYHTLLTEIGGELKERVITSAGSVADPQERVVTAIRAFVDYVRSEEAGFVVLFNGINRQDGEWSEVISEVEESISIEIADMFDYDMLPLERRRNMTRGAVGMAEAMVRNAWLDKNLTISPDDLAQDITDLIWGGVQQVVSQVLEQQLEGSSKKS